MLRAGGSVFKALRDDFGSGKSFTARWYQQQAMNRAFAVAEVQVSENDTPLHRLDTVYGREMEGLRTSGHGRIPSGDLAVDHGIGRGGHQAAA